MKIYGCLLFTCLLYICCNDKKNGEATSADQVASEKKYELVWHDEFDGDGTPDATKWKYELGLIRNEEAQYYTDSLKNTRMEDGHLILEAHKEQIANTGFTAEDAKRAKENREFAAYTSASITTKTIAEFTYGKFEVRAKLPSGRGIWPAIWMLGKNIDSVGWPESGEIDIMEHVGYEKDTIYGTVHTKAYNHGIGTEKGGSVFIENPYSEFHTYSVEWTPEKIDFLLDGEVYQQFVNENKTTDEWPFDQAFFLKLNVAVGGSWGGLKGIDDSIFPQRMLVDYVRVYQLK